MRSCTIDNHRYALKILLAGATGMSVDGTVSIERGEVSFDEVTERARREVNTMKECESPHLVKLGPISLTRANIAEQPVIYFTEEWLEGDDLQTILKRDRVLPIDEVIELGIHISSAIEELWSHKKVHRDVKPGNIMRRTKDGEFVLLDMGLALDLLDHSLTTVGLIPGTRLYLSPDQIDYPHKRMLDFRSDLFSLGVVLYEACTGQHPFAGDDPQTTLLRILSVTPTPPSSLRKEVPPQLSTIILRLLAKKPHLRYRTCRHLIEELQSI